MYRTNSRFIGILDSAIENAVTFYLEYNCIFQEVKSNCPFILSKVFSAASVFFIIY